MTALLDSNTADKLAKVCSMFASDHDGERAAAAALADRLVRARGLTWPEIISPGTASARSVEDMINFARHGDDILNAWEEGFLRSIKGRQFLTEKQLKKLSDIVAKVSSGAAA